MTVQDEHHDQFDVLRRKAEALIAQRSREFAQAPTDMIALVEELRIHQAELVIQNQQLQESQDELLALQREYADLYDNAPYAYVTISPKGIVQRFNRAAADMFDMRSELVTRSAFSTFITPQSENDYRNTLQAAIESGETEFCEVAVGHDAEGTGKWIRCAVRARLDDEGRLARWRLAAIDISRRVAVEDNLNHLLREKGLLMRELSHRVKNNLSLVASLIRIKSSETDKQIDLSDLENRVMSIAKVYEQLQNTDSATAVPFYAYMRSLLSSVFAAETGQSVTVIADPVASEDLTIEADLAIQLGLVVSEFATNAVKYGFDSSVPAEFRVNFELDQKKRTYTLQVSNSGRPFPPDVDLETTSSFGIQFVRIVLSELNARIVLVRTPQTLFTITFPVPQSNG
jgi:PAS domain S-box-containing protein